MQSNDGSVAQYLVKVFPDGSMKNIKIDIQVDGKNNSETTRPLQECSNSIKQIILLIQYVLNYLKEHPQRNIYYTVTSTVNTVAYNERVTSSTVHSKITRYLSLSAKEFREKLDRCIRSKASVSDELVYILRDRCKASRNPYDSEEIDSLIEKMQCTL